MRYGMKRIGKTQLKECFFGFLRGINAESLAEEFWAHSSGKILGWYKARQQPDDVVISASPEFLLAPICRKLGIHRLIASRVDARTGRFSGEKCRGAEKVRRLAEEYDVTHIDEFYTDSESDLPLAQIADKAFLVKKGFPPSGLRKRNKECPLRFSARCSLC